jgi:Mg2+/citrate symporter
VINFPNVDEQMNRLKAHAPNALMMAAVIFKAIDFNIPVSSKTPKNIPAAIITAAIINAFGACTIDDYRFSYDVS